MKNTQYFHDLVKGRYGRKIAYANVEQITADNIRNVVGNCIGAFYFNKTVIRYLWNYYKGDQPVLYRTKVQNADITNKVSENHAYEIVQFKVGQTYGEPIQLISRKDDDRINNAVDEFNDYLTDANKQEKDIKAGEWQSATGTSFKAVQFANGDIPFRIVAPTPMNTFVIYSQSTEEPLLAIQELKDADGQMYKLCYTDSYECKIVNGEVRDWKLHGFGGIPIVEFPNNHERISDIELVIGLLDAINTMQSNRMDGVEQFVQFWIKFVNCDIDPETFEKMKISHALTVKSNNEQNKSDVDIMTQELNQTECQVAKDDLWDNAQSILAIPTRESQNSGGDTQGAVSLRAGWDFSKTRAKQKDPIIKTSEKRLAKVILNVIRIKDHDLGLTARDFDVQINHSPLDNLYTKTQALDQMLKAGINPRIAVSTCGLWGDAEKVFIQSKPYFDVLYKTVDMVKKENENTKNKNRQANSYRFLFLHNQLKY